MKLSFVEAMRGWVNGKHGERPISFEVHASGQGGGVFELRGLISAPPFANDRPVTGTLTMGVMPPSIAYALAFTGDHGARYTLEATKHPSLLAPLKSMTLMRALVRDARGELVAEGEMRFDLRDLVPFAASWLPVSQTAQRLLDTRRRQVERRLLAGN